MDIGEGEPLFGNFEYEDLFVAHTHTIHVMYGITFTYIYHKHQPNV